MSEDKKGSGTHVSSNQSLMEFSDKNFDDTVSGSRPVLVDFWATWCGPCQFMLPIFDKLAKKYGDKVTFGRLNVDDNQGVAMRFDVYAIPTFIVFMNGKAIDRAVGAVGEKGLEGLLQKYQ
ncbi:MAG: thioredoxin [Nitrososphaeraceae archaeon]